VDQNDYEKAIQAVQPLLYKNQDYEQDLVNLYATAGRFDEALSLIETLDQRLGYSDNRDQTRIEIYKQSANQKGHIRFLKNRLEESPKNEQNFLTLIYTLSQYNLKEEAFSTAKLFLKTHPKSHIAHVALYKFYLDTKAYDKAIASMKIVTASNVLAPHLKVKVLSDFMRFVQQNPEYKDVLLEVQPAPSLDTSSRSSLEWAHYYEQQNQIDKALEFYEKALSESSENLQAIKSLAKLYLTSKRYERAVDFSVAQLELFPTQIELYLICSQAQLALEQIDEALETLEMGVEYIFEEDEIAVQYYRSMADLYKRKNNIKKAEAFINSAKAIQLKQ
jgi:tetratricopeptide (TPR) repeat protein